MAALHGAIALVEVQDVAVPVAQDLHFDVAGAADEALQEDGVVAERRRRFAPRLFQRAGEIGGLLHHAHAAAAAAERRLDDQRKADLARRSCAACFGIGDRLLRCPARRGMPAFCASRRAAVLSPSSSSSSAPGPTKVMPARSQARGSAGILGEESVAGMDRVDALFRGQRDDALDVEIGLDRPLALADQVGFVGLEAVQREAVFLGIDGDGAQARVRWRRAGCG